jgi:hypothetical protein
MSRVALGVTALGGASCDSPCEAEGPAVLAELTYPPEARVGTTLIEVHVQEGVEDAVGTSTDPWASAALGSPSGPLEAAECQDPPSCTLWLAELDEPGRVRVVVEWWGVVDDGVLPNDWRSTVVRVRQHQCRHVPVTLEAHFSSID